MTAATERDDAGEIGRGPLSKASAAVYRMLVLEGLLVVSLLPTIVTAALLDRDASNVPLFVISLLPLAPGLVAAIAAVTAWHRSPDLSPARAFLLSYRRDLGATLKWSAPSTALLALLAFNLVHLDAADGAEAVRPPLLLFATLLVVWQGHMVALTAAFRLRTRDAARIALSQLLSQWRYSLGILSLVLVAATVVLLASEFVLLLFAWAFALFLAVLARPLITFVTERFTTDD